MLTSRPAKAFYTPEVSVLNRFSFPTVRGVTRLLDEFHQDAAFSLRLVLRNPGFATVVILTLAVAIGANTANFTVVNALLFKPLPAVAAPHELARVKAGETQMAWPNYEDIRRDNSVFTHLIAQRTFTASLATGERPVRLTGQQTSDNFFVALAARPAMGRTYTPADARRDVVVLADHVWRARLGSDPSVLGRVLTLGGKPFEVVGIMPREFRGISSPGGSADFWIAVDPAAPGLRDRADSAFEVVGRLKPSATHEQAAAVLLVMAGQLRAAHPEIHEGFLRMSVFAVDGIRAFEGMTRRLLPAFAFLGALTIVSGFVLLIGCANIAGMLLGRASARRQEIALRLALGAGSGRLVRQLLTESLVLAVIGGVAGTILANWLAGGFTLVSASLPFGRDVDLQTDARVLTYALGLTAFTAVVFGLAPARRAARFDVVSSLKDHHGGSTARQNMRRTLVGAQVAVSTALLLWSGLFVRSLGRIHDVDPGFDHDGVLLASVTFDRESAQNDAHILTALQQRVRNSGAVHSAGLASIVPLALAGREEFDVSIADAGGAINRRSVLANRLAPGWFDTLRIPFVAGRDFTWDDREGTPRVAIVNETLARRFWNGEAHGKQIVYNRQALEVVGVVRDSKYWTLGETIGPTLYLPFRQGQAHSMTLHVRTADPRATTGVILGEMQRLAPGLSVEIEPMSEAVAVAVRPARVGAVATGAFGTVAILLSVLGVYGLVSFSVVQRRREIGVRKALGATTRDIGLMIVGSMARLTGVGLAIGIGIGVLGAVALRGFLFGVSPLDPATVAAAIAVVTASALIASGLPALAASRVDPVVTLRDT
jgi:macrolide transport system ATP-binding/permease protein